MDNNLPIGFISVDEAIEIIDKHTLEKPLVAVKPLVDGFPYLRVNGNYTLHLRTRNEDGKVISNGKKFVHISDNWDKERLIHAIVMKHKELAGYEINPEEVGLRHMTTTKDDKSNPRSEVMVDKNPMTKFGDSTRGGDMDINEG